MSPGQDAVEVCAAELKGASLLITAPHGDTAPPGGGLAAANTGLVCFKAECERLVMFENEQNQAGLVRKLQCLTAKVSSVKS